MTRKHYSSLGLITSLVVLVADQASKWWVLHVLHLSDLRQMELLPVLNLTFVRNYGITFGLLNGLGPWSALVLAAIAIAVVVGLVIWLRRAESSIVAVALGAITGGAVGNVSDRLRLGFVVDFVDAHLGVWHWYVFNLADAAIVCGVATLVLENLLTATRRGPA